MWMGGVAPLGYAVRERKLVVNEPEADRVRYIYRRYLELKSVKLLKADLDQNGIHSRAQVWKNGPHGGGSFSRGALYEMLANPIYIGEVRHKQERYPGQHQAIIERELWERVQRQLKEGAVRRGKGSGRSGANFLAGKLFDQQDEPLYVCGAAKGGRRYRYYVSRKLVRGKASALNDGWRLAAPELERAVIEALAQILRNQTLIGTALHRAGASATEIAAVLKAAEARSRQSGEGVEAVVQTIAALLKRVDLQKGGLRISLDLEPLIPPTVKLANPAALKITRALPLRLKRRGVETRLVLEGETEQSRGRDPALLKAVVRGYRWFRELASGVAADTRAIARREQLNDRYIRRLVPLALLAPEIVEAICAGRQSPALSTEELTKRTAPPLGWEEQRQLFASA